MGSTGVPSSVANTSPCSSHAAPVAVSRYAPKGDSQADGRPWTLLAPGDRPLFACSRGRWWTPTHSLPLHGMGGQGFNFP